VEFPYPESAVWKNEKGEPWNGSKGADYYIRRTKYWIQKYKEKIDAIAENEEL
jgi:hypothetical protein